MIDHAGWWVAGLVGLVWIGWIVRHGWRRSDKVDAQVIEVSRVAGGLAHEIRNPLSTLLLNLQLLDEDLAADPVADDTLRRARQRIGTTRAEADRLQRMLDDFLILVRPVSLVTRPVDLNDLVKRLVDFYRPQADSRGIGLRADLHAGPLVCMLDPQSISSAVLNLVINADEAIGERGGAIILTTRRSSPNASLEVVDDGVGMAAKELAEARTAFYSTKPNGSGLGLSTTIRLVAAHGGTLDIQSTKGVGSRFTLHLPLASAGGGGAV